MFTTRLLKAIEVLVSAVCQLLQIILVQNSYVFLGDHKYL